MLRKQDWNRLQQVALNDLPYNCLNWCLGEKQKKEVSRERQISCADWTPTDLQPLKSKRKEDLPKMKNTLGRRSREESMRSVEWSGITGVSFGQE